MSGQPVAADGDVTATVGTKPFTGADSGQWTAGAVICTPYPRLRSGAAVIYQATCTFQFAGKAGNSPVTGAEIVTLTADRGAKLQRGQQGVLRSGDVAQGKFGNKLIASSSRRLRTL